MTLDTSLGIFSSSVADIITGLLLYLFSYLVYLNDVMEQLGGQVAAAKVAMARLSSFRK